jgi:hypothetical protein
MSLIGTYYEIFKEKINIVFFGWLCIVAVVVYSFYTITIFKLFYRDSIWVASYAYNITQNGSALDVMAREAGMVLAHGRIHDIFYGYFMAIFDTLPHAHRYLSWILSNVALLLYFRLSIALGYTSKVSIFSVLFLAINEHFLLASHIARTDVLAFVFVLFVLLLMIDKSTAVKASLAGFIAAMAIDVHLSTQYMLFMLLSYELVQKKSIKQIYEKYKYFFIAYLCGLIVVVLNNIAYLDTIQLGIQLLQAKAIETSIFDRVSWYFLFGLDSAYFRWLFYPLVLVLAIYICLPFNRPIKGVLKSMSLFIGGFMGFVLLGRMNHHYIILFNVFLYQILIFQVFRARDTLIKLFLLLFTVIFIGIQSYIVIRDGGADIQEYQFKIKAAFKVNPDVVVIAPDDLWFLYKDNEFNGYHSRIDFANLKRTKKVLFISNEIHRRFIELGVSLGEGTGVNKFNKEFLKDFSKVSQVKDKHYGGFGITKNNIITFYTNY